MNGHTPLEEARRALYWKIQGARSHMQMVRETEEAFAAYDAAILTAERERTAALVAVAKRFTWNPWMAGEDYRVGLLRDALRAYEEGVSE